MRFRDGTDRTLMLTEDGLIMIQDIDSEKTITYRIQNGHVVDVDSDAPGQQESTRQANKIVAAALRKNRG
jgi:hypothetical protein